MTLREMTDLMSRVGLREPELVGDRKVRLFIQACIEEARKQPTANAPLSPVDYCQH